MRELVPPKPKTRKGGRDQNPPEVIWNRYTETAGGCWIYTMACDRYGYGQVTYHNYNGHRAHVVAWLLTYGPIPDDMTIHHKCATPRCINPQHMELLSSIDNAREGKSRQAIPIVCKRGHQGQYKQRKNGGRLCMECDRTAYRMTTTKWKTAHAASK